MAKTRVEVKGLRELGVAMRSLSADVNEKVGRASMAAGSGVIKKRAQELAPVAEAAHQLGVRKDQIAQPGNLRRNIIVKRLPKSETGRTQQYIVGVRHGKGRVPLDAFYWKFLEFGTVKMAARPFMRPAFEEKKVEAVQKISERLRQRIERAQRSGK